MKFATYKFGGHEQVGLVDANAERIHPVDAADMVDLIARFDEIKPAIRPNGSAIALSEVTLLAPIPRPRRNIFCVGKNYRDHAKEFANSGYEAGAVKDVDDYPAVFTKPATCVVGPGAAVETHPTVTNSVDYEVELTIVIGRGGRDIKRADAMSHIFGYTIINDVTARDLQAKHKQWFLGKSLDTFCPMGPWIATRDELDGARLGVRCWINGELRQNANSKDLIFDIPTLIATISSGLTLRPGDIIATGTPAGVGIGFTPPRFLEKGDLMEIEIDGLGKLSNKVQ